MVKSWTLWAIGVVMSGVVAVTAIAADAEGTQALTPSTTTSAASVTTSTSNLPKTSNLLDLTDLDEIATGARFAVEVLDVDTGETASYGEGSYDTASIVKVDILVALLHQAQGEGRGLTEDEQDLATAMIERSDNISATALFNLIGGEAGLEAFNDIIGLTGTDVGADGYWGLTQTTAADQIRVLEVVFGSDSVLTNESQAYVSSLMSNVIDSQLFGVSAVGDDAALKVGYLQRSATGLWDVNSIGETEVNGHTYLVAVLSDGNGSYEAGVALVDQVVGATFA